MFDILTKLDCHGAKAPRNDGLYRMRETVTVIARRIYSTKQSRLEGNSDV